MSTTIEQVPDRRGPHRTRQARSPIGNPLLHFARLEADATMGELAARAGVCVETIGRLERGEFRPTRDTETRIAAALGYSRAQLFPASTRPSP